MSECLLHGMMHATASQALHAVELAFEKAHVFLTEAHQLGGLALVVHWDMEADHRKELEAALRDAAIRLDEESIANLRAPWTGVRTGALNVTLEHEGRDSKVPVPAVPG